MTSADSKEYNTFDGLTFWIDPAKIACSEFSGDGDCNGLFRENRNSQNNHCKSNQHSQYNVWFWKNFRFYFHEIPFLSSIVIFTSKTVVGYFQSFPFSFIRDLLFVKLNVYNDLKSHVEMFFWYSTIFKDIKETLYVYKKDPYFKKSKAIDSW